MDRFRGENWSEGRDSAAYAGRFGITQLSQMKNVFGVRWAYHLQDQILGQKLTGVVFPSLEAGLCSSDQEFSLAVARDRAQRIQKENPNLQQTRLLQERKYDDSLVWAVPAWFGEKPEVISPNPHEIQQFHENTDDMKLYAMRVPYMREPRIGD